MLGAGYRVRNFGHVGATAASYGHLPGYVRAKEYAPDIELWMLGTNDSKDFNRSRYVGDFRRTIEALGSSHIIIMSPPLVLAERYGINSAIVDGAVPNAAREVAAAARDSASALRADGIWIVWKWASRRCFTSRT